MLRREPSSINASVHSRDKGVEFTNGVEGYPCNESSVIPCVTDDEEVSRVEHEQSNGEETVSLDNSVYKSDRDSVPAMLDTTGLETYKDFEIEKCRTMVPSVGGCETFIMRYLFGTNVRILMYFGQHGVLKGPFVCLCDFDKFRSQDRQTTYLQNS